MGKNRNHVEDGVLLTPVPRTVGNKEHFQRMNYLYQLAMWHTITCDKDEQSFAQLYSKNMDLISKKTRTRMLPRLKRTLCKKCHRVMVPYKTMRIHVNDSTGSLQLICHCGSMRNFPIQLDPGYRCYAENDENLISM